MTNQEIVKLWTSTIGGKTGFENPPAADLALIASVVTNVVERWRNKTRDEDDPDAAFKTLYMKHKDRAQAWTVAIVEMVRAIGDGEPERFEQCRTNSNS
jgi:hypothetical protein